MSEGRGQDPRQYILQVVATLALDTSTPDGSVAVRRDGAVVYARGGDLSRPHGMRLPGEALAALEACGLTLGDVTLLAVGLGPGPFTGLRVGLATAKGLAHGLGLPIIGVSTAEALLAGTQQGSVLLLPAGPSDRLLVRHDTPASLIPAGTEPDLEPDATIVAVDLADRATADEVARGETARAGLAAALLAIGAGRRAAGAVDDLARLVPEYVALPRGVWNESGEVAWSHDRP